MFKFKLFYYLDNPSDYINQSDNTEHFHDNSSVCSNDYSDNSDNDDDSRYIDSRMNQMLKTMPKQILKTLKQFQL